MKSERQSWSVRFIDFCLRQSLWLVSAGLMLASSGLDGAYLTRLMPPSLFWLGYVLNTMADVASEIMMYWFGRLRLLRKDDKRARWSLPILIAEVLLVGYACFFSWRQLLLVLPAVESANDVRWVAPIAAGFIPLALVAVGYTQALLAGRVEEPDDEKARLERETKRKAKELELQERELFAEEHRHVRRRAPTSQAREVLLRDGYKCYYCGDDLRGREQDQIHIDHFYPVIAGGSDRAYNLVVSCARCNLSKNGRIPTNDEVLNLKLHLVNRSVLGVKEKVRLLYQSGTLTKQRDIATKLGISPSYVSATLKELPATLSEDLASFGEVLNLVGEPETSAGEADGSESEESYPLSELANSVEEEPAQSMQEVRE